MKEIRGAKKNGKGHGQTHGPIGHKKSFKRYQQYIKRMMEHFGFLMKMY